MDFRDYLRRQIQDRHMTIREFAAFIDVAPSTISRAIDERDPKPPGLDFLMKLSQATGERLGVLIELAYPDFAIGEAFSPTTRLFAERFQALPIQLQQVIQRLIDDLYITKNFNEGE